jgi:hypothetical protein
MAITYRSGNIATGVATIVITKPAGVVATDVLWAIIITDGTIAAPTGWVSRASGVTPTSASNVAAFSRVADGGANDGATYTFTCTGATGGEGLIDAYIGVDNTTPIDATATVATGTAATVTWPNITTVTNNAWHLASIGDGVNGAVTSTPTSYTQRSVTATIAKNSDRNITPAGLVTGVTATGGVEWVAISAALRPALAVAAVFPKKDIVKLQAINRGQL